MRSLFRQVVLKCVFVFRSNSLVNPKDLCFSGMDGTRWGPVELKYIFLTMRGVLLLICGIGGGY